METTRELKPIDQKELEQEVKSMYNNVALHPEVEYHFEMGRSLAERLGYPGEFLDKIPAESVDSFAGVGYYFDIADIKNGESVLDMGSGSGMDVFLAALKSGTEGSVTGIEMTSKQLEKSEILAENSGFTNVSFVKSYIEEMPFDSETMDVIVSNGVINLSIDKAQVFKEAARLLKPGGRLAISDIVSSIQLPENITCDVSLWASCIGGAMQFDEYIELIGKAGLQVENVMTNPYEFISKSARNASKKYGIQSISLLARKL